MLYIHPLIVYCDFVNLFTFSKSSGGFLLSFCTVSYYISSPNCSIRIKKRTGTCNSEICTASGIFMFQENSWNSCKSSDKFPHGVGKIRKWNDVFRTSDHHSNHRTGICSNFLVITGNLLTWRPEVTFLLRKSIRIRVLFTEKIRTG